jgi:tRNA(Ile)-lysidine synthase
MRAETVTDAVNAKIRRCVAEHDMLAGCSGVLVGFSGGADSTALLYWLAGYCAEHGLRLAALHVNHKIRDDEAERDEQFCRSFCESRGIEFIRREADVPALAASTGRGIEETARDVRYTMFREAASELGFERIATAHNADDNLETVLFNLARGTAATGLAGIPPVRDKIIRPLLYCEKDELVLFCRENALDFVFDSTNDDTAYTRNYIRQEIIPLLERINPAVRRNAARMCRALREDNKTLAALAAGYSLSGGRKNLAALDDSLLLRVLSREFDEYTGGLTLETAHLEAAVNLIRSNRASFALSLPGAVRLICDRDSLHFAPDPRERESPPEPFRVTLHPGENYLPGGMLLVLEGGSAPDSDGADGNISKYIKEYKNIYKLFKQAFVRSDRIIGVLSAETPRGSAKMRVRGMSRTVKNLLAEHKLTKAERRKTVMICDGEGPLWIPGIALRDGCEALPDDRENTLIIVHFLTEEL